MNELIFKCGKCKKIMKDIGLNGCSCGSASFDSIFKKDMRAKALEIVNG